MQTHMWKYLGAEGRKDDAEHTGFASLKTGIKKQSMRMAVWRKVLSVEFSVIFYRKKAKATIMSHIFCEHDTRISTMNYADNAEMTQVWYKGKWTQTE